MGIIKSFAFIISLGIAALGLTVTSSQATTVSNASSGLVSPDISINFGNAPTPNAIGDSITDEFSNFGVTFFGDFEYDDQSFTLDSITDGFLKGSATATSPNSINFSTNVTDAVFSFRTQSGKTTFSAFLGGNLVQTLIDADTNDNVPGNGGKFYGFTGLLFDQLTFGITTSFSTEYFLDNLQFNTAAVIPLPAALPLFLTGLAGLGLMRRRRRQG